MVSWRHFWYRLGLFSAPIIASAVVIVMLWACLENVVFRIIGLLLLGYFISPFGREVLIPAAVISLLGIHGMGQMALDIALVVGVVLFVDVMCSIFLLWNLDLVKFLPVIGRWVDGIERYGRMKLRKNSKKRRSTFMALAGYVALPFQGSGGIMATIIGMLTGLKKRRVWAAVWTGSFAGSLAIAVPSFYFGEMLIDVFGSAIWYVLGLVLMLGILAYIVMGYWKARKKNLA